MEARLGEIQKQKAELEREEDDLITAIDALIVAEKPQTTTDAIQAFVESEKRQREAKVARLQELNATGIDLNALNPKAPIDRHRSRRNRPANARVR